jgi:hypothetical protein
MREVLDKLLVNFLRIDAANITQAERLKPIIHFSGFPGTAGLFSLPKYMKNRSPSSIRLC